MFWLKYKEKGKKLKEYINGGEAMFEKQTAIEEANRITNKIVQQYKPYYVYLFGSLVYGEPNKYSDIDLCVVMDFDGKRKVDVLFEINDLTFDRKYPLDYIIYQKDEFDNNKDNKSTLQGIINSKGVKLYG
jgi:predicted nucleotidyltransferase